MKQIKIFSKYLSVIILIFSVIHSICKSNMAKLIAVQSLRLFITISCIIIPGFYREAISFAIVKIKPELKKWHSQVFLKQWA